MYYMCVRVCGGRHPLTGKMDLLCMSTTLLGSTLALVISCFFILGLKTFTGKSIGNPKFPPVKGTVFGQLFYLNRLYDFHAEVAKKHPTFRLLASGRSDIYTAEPRNVEHILKTNFSKYQKGEHNQDIAKDFFGQGIFVVDGEKWQQQRKLASFEFSTRVLRDFSCAVFRKNAAKLARVISEFSDHGRVFDMQNLLMTCTMDSIFKVGFGVDLNCLEGSNKDGIKFMEAFDESHALLYLRYVDPFWKLKRFINVGSEASLKNNIKILDDFVYGLIKTKRERMAAQEDSGSGGQRDGRDDMLTRFLLESKKDPENMSDKYLRDIILNFLIAGKDTTASTLSWFFYELGKNPSIQAKVAQEIQDVLLKQDEKVDMEKTISSITDAALEKMHYLHASLTETLRLHPAVPVDGGIAEVDDVLPDGFQVRKGDGVNYMAYAMGRMSYIWGEDAEEFKPERWLKNGSFQPESPFKFVAFHAGPRSCLGKDFAYRQMKIVSMALLCFFRFKLADDSKSVTYKTMVTLHLDKGLHLHAVKR